MKRQKDCAVRAQGQDKRHYLASQNNFEQDHFSLKILRRSNLNMVKLAYIQSHAKGSTGTCLLSSSLWKKQVSRDSSYNRQNSSVSSVFLSTVSILFINSLWLFIILISSSVLLSVTLSIVSLRSSKCVVF